MHEDVFSYLIEMYYKKHLYIATRFIECGIVCNVVPQPTQTISVEKCLKAIIYKNKFLLFYNATEDM